MKHLLLTTIAAVLVVGCGEAQQSTPAPESKTEPPTAKAPDISIHVAAVEGKIEAVKQHLAAGTDVNAKIEGDEWTPLHSAAFNGHKEIVELLISEGADVNANDKISGTSLHLAAFQGYKEIVELLIARGADVNAEDNICKTPLHQAAYSGQKEIVELLIAKGADVNAKSEIHGTPLDTAKKLEDYQNSPETKAAKKETADLLRKHGGKRGAVYSIHIAAKGDIEAVKQHLAAGTDVNAKSEDGGTPLHLAAEYGHKEIVELLIAKGADVNATDEDGETPLDHAEGLRSWPPLEDKVKAAKKEIADLLRKHGGKTGDELKAEGN